jgi:hypothetical protein
MALGILLDTDILIKCACYALLEHIRPPAGFDSEIGILGVAKYTVRTHLERLGQIANRPSAQRLFETYLDEVSEVEPTEEELMLASAIEEAGLQKGVDLDVGESQLCAIAILRASPLLVTGDKRAIMGAESLQVEVTRLPELQGRIVCLEQVIIGIADRMSPVTVRLKVCAEPGVDKSLTICCGCRGDSSQPFSLDGLYSYVRHLRTQAPTLLYESDGM